MSFYKVLPEQWQNVYADRLYVQDFIRAITFALYSLDQRFNSVEL